MKKLVLYVSAGLFAAGSCFSITAETNDKTTDIKNFPAIAIHFVSNEGKGLIPVLKLQYAACKLQLETARKAHDQGGVAWEMVKQNLPKGYVIDAAVNEPNWEFEKVGTFTSEEYSAGDKYAHYQYKANYSISEDGRCSLLEEPVVKIELDDTVTRYRIKYKGRNKKRNSRNSSTPEWTRYATQRVYQNPSPVKLRAENAARLQAMSQNLAFQEMAKKMLTPGEDGSCPPNGCKKNNLQRLEDLKKQVITKEVNFKDAGNSSASSDKPRIIANQPVDRVDSENLGTSVYYWHRAHKHPGIMGRNIVLRTETKSLMGGKAIKEAYRFATADRLPDAIFQPAPGLLKRVATQSSSYKPQR